MSGIDLIDEGAVEKLITEAVNAALNKTQDAPPNAVQKLIDQAIEAASDLPEETEDPIGYCHLNEDQFPCNQDNIVLVSLGLAAAGLGLIMVFFLLGAVSLLCEVLFAVGAG